MNPDQSSELRNKRGTGKAMVVQQHSDERQVTSEQNKGQEAQLELAERLQPVMAKVQEQIQQIVREQQERASARLPQEEAGRDGGAIDGTATQVETRPAQPSQADQDRGQHSAQDQQDEGEKDPLVTLLREQIIDAMDPVLDDLRENVEQAVRQQRQNVMDMPEEEVHQRVDQALEPMRQEVEQQVDQTIQDVKQEREKPPQTKLQEAIQRTVKALKETMQWLARTLRTLLKTVVALLKAVANLVVVILLALFEGLKSLGQAKASGVKSVSRGIMEVLQKMLLGLAKRVAGNLLSGRESRQPGQPQKAQA
jgi:hypothetical protein